MHIFDSFFLVALQAIFGCSLPRVVAGSWCAFQPFAKPFVRTHQIHFLLLRLPSTEGKEQRQSYKVIKRGAVGCSGEPHRSFFLLFFFKPDTSAFHVFGPLFVAFLTIARMQKQTDSQQKSVKLRSPRKRLAKLSWMPTNTPPMVSTIGQSTYKDSKLHKRLLQHQPYKTLYVQLLLLREEAAAKVPSFLCCATL